MGSINDSVPKLTILFDLISSSKTIQKTKLLKKNRICTRLPSKSFQTFPLRRDWQQYPPECLTRHCGHKPPYTGVVIGQTSPKIHLAILWSLCPAVDVN